MQIRHFLSGLCLAVAVFLTTAEIWLLFLAHGNPHFLVTTRSVVENFAIAIAGAIAGVMLLRNKGRSWLWLALLVSAFGMWKFWVWPILIGRSMPAPFFLGGAPWLILMNLVKQILLPVMLGVSAILLFQREPDAASGTVPAVNRCPPQFGWLSIFCPALGIPSAYMILRSTRSENGFGVLAGFIIFSYLALVLGFVFVIVAYVRWEEYGILPLIGFLLNTTPLLWVSHAFGAGSIAGPILGILFCATCTFLSLATREKGRSWALLAAIPSVFMLFSMFVPIVSEIIRHAYQMKT